MKEQFLGAVRLCNIDDLRIRFRHRSIMALCSTTLFRSREVWLRDRLLPRDAVMIPVNAEPASWHPNLSAQLLRRKPNVLIAVGGGALIDTVKLLRCSVPQLQTATFVALPSTAGSGAEATSFATQWGDRKCSVADGAMLPDQVFHCPDLLLSCPPKVAVSAWGDAISQAFESLWSRSMTTASRNDALHALALLRLSGEPPGGDEEKMLSRMRGAYYSGRAIARARTNYVHALSYPLTRRFGVPHGWAVSLLLPKLAEFYLGAKKSSGELYHSTSEIVNLRSFLSRPSQLGPLFGLPARLSEFGVTEREIHTLVREATKTDRFENSVMDFDARKAADVYRTLI